MELDDGEGSMVISGMGDSVRDRVGVGESVLLRREEWEPDRRGMGSVFGGARKSESDLKPTPWVKSGGRLADETSVVILREFSVCSKSGGPLPVKFGSPSSSSSTVLEWTSFLGSLSPQVMLRVGVALREWAWSVSSATSRMVVVLLVDGECSGQPSGHGSDCN